MLDGAFGSKFAVFETLAAATPLIFTGLAIAVAFSAKLYNIGGEGQFYAGAIVATFIGTGAVEGWPPIVVIGLMIIAGALAGGALLLGPAFLKVKLGVDEVVTTLLLNFIMLQAAVYLVTGPLRHPYAPAVSIDIKESAMLPLLGDVTRLHWGFFIAIAAAVIVWLLMQRSTLGYEIKAVGFSDKASRFAGIGITRTIVLTALVSGGLAGLAGVIQLCGLEHHLSANLSQNCGYAGIVVALMARMHPIGVIASGIFFAAIAMGSDNMSRSFGVPTYLSDVVQAVALLLMLATLLLVEYRPRKG